MRCVLDNPDEWAAHSTVSRDPEYIVAHFSWSSYREYNKILVRDAWTETVVSRDAWDETVIVKDAWDEYVFVNKCSCGATK